MRAGPWQVGRSCVRSRSGQTARQSARTEIGEPVSQAPIKGTAGRMHVAAQVRLALRAGDLVPGQRLVEQDLADQYGVTRTSAREALFDLAADEVVELVPHRGARIRVVSVAEAVQITECRAVLERLCARKTAEYADKQQREQLADVGVQLRAAVEEGAWETYSELNRRLHDLIIEFSGQSVAKRQLERLNVQMVRFQFRLALRPGRPLESLPQLLAIVDAITAGDPDAADAAVAAQLASVTEQLRATHAAAGLDATPSQ
jgi:DNA-binding GntR family transcriptional regulator